MAAMSDTIATPAETATVATADNTVELPSWLPPLVAEQARLAYAKADTPDAANLVRRVTTHEDMNGVWKELLKRRRDDHKKTNDYAYPVLDPADDGYLPKLDLTDWRPTPAMQGFRTRSEWLQQLGLARLYNTTLNLARGCTSPQPRDGQ